MRTHRAVTHEWSGGVCRMRADVKALIAKLPCHCKTYELEGGDGSAATVTIYPMEQPPIAFITPESASWAEGFVAKYVNDDGEIKEG